MSEDFNCGRCGVPASLHAHGLLCPDEMLMKPRFTSVEHAYRSTDAQLASVLIALTQVLDIRDVQRVMEHATKPEHEAQVRRLRKQAQDAELVRCATPEQPHEAP